MARRYFHAFVDVAALLSRHRQLAWELTKREITDRHAGEFFGTAWALAHPLLLMAVYVFVFVFVFKIRLGGTLEFPLDYTTYLLSGLIPWLAFNESMAKSTVAITSNATLVKQIIFPTELLPIRGVLSSLGTQLVTMTVLVLYVLSVHHGLLVSYALLPLLLLLQFSAMVGVSFVLAALGLFAKDIREFVQVFGIIGLFIMPIFYLPDQVPALFKPLLYANPFSHLVWCYQDVFYFGGFHHPWAWVVWTAFSLGALMLGHAVFQKLKPMFGNVL